MSTSPAPLKQTKTKAAACYSSLPPSPSSESSTTMLKKRFSSLLKSKSSSSNRNSIIGTPSSTTTNNNNTPAVSATPGSSSNSYANAPTDSPEATCARAIAAFCESGNNSSGGEEVLHLPVIVDAAESSPQAAQAACHQIRNFLGKEYSKKPHIQYNAIMLVRILCDNPGASFTRNFDEAFVSTVKKMLRHSMNGGTQQIVRETLDALEVNKQHDAGLQGLLAMWNREKGNGASLSRGGPMYQQPAPMQGYPNPRQPSSRQLPTAVELASRVEEARNTAKILLQLVQSTPTSELLSNELMKEFSERCQSASRSMQVYIAYQDQAPDHDTMQTLIETNEQLSLAMSRYQRAVLAARREMGVPASPPAVQEPIGHSAFAPQAPQQNMSISQSGLAATPVNGWQSPAGPQPSHIAQYQQPEPHQQNPFADPTEQQHNTSPFPSQSFAIDSGAVPAKPYQHRDELENMYSSGGGGDDARTPVSQPSPVFHHTDVTTANAPVPVSPQTPPRPGLGPYHQSEISESYAGRQSSAANGLTMHGAGSAAEKDSMTSRGRGY